MEALLFDRGDLGHLAMSEPENVLLDWMLAFEQDPGFSKAVDDGLKVWIESAWGHAEPEEIFGSVRPTTYAWYRAAQILAFGQGLEGAVAALRERFLEDPQFLRDLSEARQLDPEGRTWLALARNQEGEDRSLLPHWWRLCSLPPDVPWYHGGYGIHGLRRLPAEGGGQKGFPEEVAHGLLLLAEGLAQRVDEGWLGEPVARSEFEDIAHLTMRAVPMPERWGVFWGRASKRRFRSEKAHSWIDRFAPRSAERRPGKGWLRPNPDWYKRAIQIGEPLERAEESAIVAARELLREEDRFAELTGDTYSVVRSATTFSKTVRATRPTLALEWADLARQREPWNPYSWTVTGEALRAGGRGELAIRVFLQATARFPENKVAWTGLAESLRSQGRLDESEQFYRETVERFPDDVFARNGLAESLRSQGFLQESEQVYRETVERFPNDEVARNGLAESLRSQDRLEESEQVYRETVDRFPKDVVARNGLAESLRSQGRLEESEQVYREIMECFPDDAYARMGLAVVLLQLGAYEAEAESLLEDAAQRLNNSAAREFLDRLRGAMDPATRDYPTTRPVGGLIAEEDLPADLRAWLLGSKSGVGRSSIADAPQPQEIREGETAKLNATEEGLGTSDELAEKSEVQALEREDGACLQPEVPSQSGGSEVPTFQHQDLAPLLLDSYTLRRWSRRSGRGGRAISDLRQDAEEVLSKLLALVGRDGRVAGEAGLLRLEEGGLDAALVLLEEAGKRFPANARVRYALARAHRMRIQRDGLTFDPDRSQQLMRPWRQLARLAPHYRPVALLGEGRSWLAQVDGRRVEERALENFGELAWWTHRQATASEGGAPRSKDEPAFSHWWSQELRRSLFGSMNPRHIGDLPSVPQIRSVLDERGASLDLLEEAFIDRFDPYPMISVSAA
ncbi:MAG: tetratricopeptide repeat protein [Acidobacteriota bacterium]|nr:tetratricopeptide repeat protein [Acidobacteriota bacterium]